ncbi:MAG: FAD-dependent monooxygenase [Chryseosolibacter sp.]
MRKIVIIGGGLAGLISSIQLIRAGIACTVIEKKSYPLHRVCGEYISNEALPFLKASGLYPEDFKLPQVKYFEFSSIAGETARLPLDLGGFGISRYSFDHFLYRIAQAEGVSFQLNTEVSAIDFREDQFEIVTGEQTIVADVAIGSFGKRSRIDIQQNRNFIKERSPWVGVKYHVRCNHPDNLISLHNFPAGYCGVCNVEEGITNLCYLTHRNNLKGFGDVQLMEKNVLFKNPLIENIFSNAIFIFKRPEVINEISFETKAPVENHILMAGDAAGMITPVCGNGMAMAIRSGKILSELLIDFCADRMDRHTLEDAYRKAWNMEFKTRLWFGRSLQRFFGHEHFSTLAVNLARLSRPVAGLIIRKTHGSPF